MLHAAMNAPPTGSDRVEVFSAVVTRHAVILPLLFAGFGLAPPFGNRPLLGVLRLRSCYVALVRLLHTYDIYPCRLGGLLRMFARRRRTV